MRRFFCLFGVLLFVSNLSFADTNILVDFNDLLDDGDGQNSETVFNYSEEADINTSEEDKAAMRTSLLIENWRVEYNASARNTVNTRLTRVVSVASKELGKTVMGVRTVFPSGPYDADATVVPPFLISANGLGDGSEDFSTRFDGKGVLRNVGSIKSVALTIRGLDYPHAVSVVIEDSRDRRVKEIPLGTLDFQGWKTLVWANPNYVYAVRDLTLERTPLYPFNVSTVRLLGIKFYRKSSDMGGDFITYLSNISVTYDKAVDDTLPIDIDHETVWGILAAREHNNYRVEMERFGRRQVLEYNKKKLQDQSRPNTFPADGDVLSPVRRNRRSAGDLGVSSSTDNAGEQ